MPPKVGSDRNVTGVTECATRSATARWRALWAEMGSNPVPHLL